MKKRINIFLVILISLTSEAFSQVVGGRGNSDMTPKSVEPEKLTAGGLTGDVNLFTGDYNASLVLGSVSTPGGLSYSLSYHYSSAFTVGGTSQNTQGIPYGDGWSLNIPTISVETDVFNNFSNARICQENQSQLGALINYGADGLSAVKEGDVYWFSPHIDIPGVVSGRAVFKYVDVSDNKAPVFVLNNFETSVEIRFYGDYWTVLLADGTKYFLGTTIINQRAPSNARTLYYNQQAITTDDNLPRDQDIANTLYPSVANAILPKKSYTSWYCDRITHTNYPLQSILFTYEKYGAFNYFQEFMQERFNTAFREKTNNTTFDTDYDFTAYTDILLHKISSFAPETPVEELRLTYSTDLSILGRSSQFIDFRQSNAFRKDSLYSYKAVTSILGNDDFNSWMRYNHIKKDEFSTYNFVNPSNPYLSENGYLREQIPGANKISFDHGFLESERISNNELYPGDIYEIRAKVSRTIPASLLRGNSTFDIAVVTGINNTSVSSPSGSSYASNNGNNGIFYQPTKYNITRGLELFSTFNMALKWHMGYQQASKQISNFFVMPNIPDGFQGINIQIGAGNSDNDFSLNPDNHSELTDINQQAHAKASYAHALNALTFPLKSAANISHCFGVGLPWGNIIPLYSQMASTGINTPDDPEYQERAYQFWWKTPNAVFEHRPTKVDNTTFLEEFELIRYTKNPLMLKRVEHYILNGEIGFEEESGWRLKSRKDLSYTTESNNTLENLSYQNGDPLIFKGTKTQLHILLQSIRDIPVDYDEELNDTTLTQATFLSYALFQNGANTTFDQSKPYNGNRKYVLNRILDHLGGLTLVVYYPINDNRTYYNSRYNKPEFCNSNNAMKPYGMYQAITIHPVVKYIYKEDEQNLLRNGQTSEYYKRWEYDFDYTTRKGISTDFKLYDDNFRSRYYTPFKTGFGKVSVYSPRLNSGNARNHTVYEHYTHDENMLTVENHLFFGKIKSIKTYDAYNQLHEEKIINYDYTLAFENGYLRPNPYRSQMNYEEKDYNRIIHPYEYKDYYLNEEVEAGYIWIDPVDSSRHFIVTETGSDAYLALDIPTFNGNYTLFELPKFLEFEFYNKLIAENPAYLFNSYFVKKTSEISRLYDNFKYINPDQITDPRGPGVEIAPNPDGLGFVNPKANNPLTDAVFLTLIQGNVLRLQTVANTVITASPLSDNVLKQVVTTPNFTTEQKTTILQAQHGLSNLIWTTLLPLAQQYKPQQLFLLIKEQEYFADAILMKLIDINNEHLDQQVFEAMMLKKEQLSNQVIEYLLETGSFVDNNVFMTIIAAQPELTEDLLRQVMLHERTVIRTVADVLLNRQLTDEIYKALISRPDIVGDVLATVIEQDPQYPSKETLLEILDQVPLIDGEAMLRIVSSAKREIEDEVKTQIIGLFPLQPFRDILHGSIVLIH